MTHARFTALIERTLVVLALSLLGTLFLYFIGIDAIEGRSSFQFFADTPTYYAAARGFLEGKDTELLLSLTSNYLGPTAIIWATGFNHYLAMVVNVFIFTAATALIARRTHIPFIPLVLLLLLNPLTLSSIFAVNKEIFSILVTALAISYIVEHRRRDLAVAIALSVLVRWQLTAFLLIMAPMLAIWDGSSHRRWLKLVTLALGLSITYVAFTDLLRPLNESFMLSVKMQSDRGSGLFEQLMYLQMAGLYILIFPIKIASLLFGLGLRMDYLVWPVNIYNHVFQLLHSLALIILFALLAANRKLGMTNVLVYVAGIYLIFFGITPIYAPRYFYPVYVLGAVVLLSARVLPARRSIQPPSAAVSDPGQ